MVTFGPIVALDRFSATVPAGVTGLLGPNGAGKSTFIKTALGLLSPTSGSVRVNGYDPTRDMMAVREKIGYLPEHECLPPSLSAVALVAYLGRLSGMGRSDALQRAHEVFDFVALGEERYRLIGEFSTGMKQKVKLAQAIVHDPPILFFDEPTNGMDPQGREEMLELIIRIGATDKTVLVSSHILHEVEQVCSRVLIIHRGKLVKEGDIATLMSGEEGLFALTVRGEPVPLERFTDALGAHSGCEIVETAKQARQYKLEVRFRPTAESEERGLKSGPKSGFKRRNMNESKIVFALAAEHGVQVRSYRPERFTLEDVFVSAV